MPPEMMIRDHHCTVISNQPCGRDLWQMALKPTEATHKAMAGCRPGQFVMIDLPKEPFYFRRPMSVMSVEPDGTLTVFYKVMGQGTALLAQLKPQSTLTVMGPLGSAFGDTLSAPLSSDLGHVLLIGGGIGIAPLIAYGQLLRRNHIPVKCLYGVRSAEDIGVAELLNDTFQPEHVHIATDNGSYGLKGHVGHLLADGQTRHQWITQAQAAMICGPTVMMRAVSEQLLTEKPTLPVEVSLEEHMPCGTGACGGCVVFLNTGQLPAKVCVDGPIINARLIAWTPIGTSNPGTANPGTTNPTTTCLSVTPSAQSACAAIGEGL